MRAIRSALRCFRKLPLALRKFFVSFYVYNKLLEGFRKLLFSFRKFCVSAFVRCMIVGYVFA